MTSQTIDEALIAYQNALTPFERGHSIGKQEVLEVLNARDNLHLALGQSTQLGVPLLDEIHSLDQQLEAHSIIMVQAFDFKSYRQSFVKAADHWWWFLDRNPQFSDWIYRGGTTLAWAATIGLLVDISSRFLIGGAGFVGLSAVALSNLIALLKARSDFTKLGKEGTQLILRRFKISKTGQSRFLFGSTALLSGIFFIFFLLLPQFSKKYNQLGKEAQASGKLGSAERNYRLAISLNSDNKDAHYNLGTFYEDIQDLEQAETQYLIAIRGEFPEAYNNLARLYLKPSDQKTSKAIGLLNQGLSLANDQQSFPEIKYSLYKNLGWAHFQKAKYPEAESALEAAIAISEQPDATYITRPASAHCLLAQTQDKLNNPDSIQVWQRCCQLGNSSNPEEDDWLLLARDRLTQEGFDFNQSCRPTATPIS